MNASWDNYIKLAQATNSLLKRGVGGRVIKGKIIKGAWVCNVTFYDWFEWFSITINGFICASNTSAIIASNINGKWLGF